MECNCGSVQTDESEKFYAGRGNIASLCGAAIT